MRQAEFAIGQFNSRRQYEWKVTIGLWALIAAFVAFLRTQNPQFDQFLILGIIVWILYSFFWLRGVWVGNQDDKNWANHYLKEAEKIFNNTDHIPQTGKLGRKRLKDLP